MKHPFVGVSVTYKEYFAGKIETHLVGILGGCIWGLGTALSYIAAEKAGTAISYALGQGAPMTLHSNKDVPVTSWHSIY